MKISKHLTGYFLIKFQSLGKHSPIRDINLAASIFISGILPLDKSFLEFLLWNCPTDHGKLQKLYLTEKNVHTLSANITFGRDPKKSESQLVKKVRD